MRGSEPMHLVPSLALFFLGGGGDPGLCVPINNWESLPHVKLHHSLTVCTSYFQNVLKRLRRYHD